MIFVVLTRGNDNKEPSSTGIIRTTIIYGNVLAIRKWNWSTRTAAELDAAVGSVKQM